MSTPVGGTRGGRGPGRVRPRLAGDITRYWVSTAVAVVCTLGVAVVFIVVGDRSSVDLRYVAAGYFTVWVLFCVTYSAITWRLMRTIDGPTLAAWLSEDEQGRRRRRRAESWYATGGPTGAVFLCCCALAAVLSVATVPVLRSEAAVVALAVAVVVASWLLLVVVYAVHYAREQTNSGGLRFVACNDSTPLVFLDFIYLAVQVATSLASSDVVVTTTAMRREVAIHSVVTFVFNTVVVTLLVSLLVSAGGA